MPSSQLEQRVRGLPGIVAGAVSGRTITVLVETDRDRDAARAAVRSLAPGARVRVLGGHRGPRRPRAISDLAAVLGAVLVAGGLAGAASAVLGRVLEAPRAPQGARVVAEAGAPRPDAIRTVVPAPVATAQVLGEVVVRPDATLEGDGGAAGGAPSPP